MKLNKATFYLLSWTWGLPMTLIGAVVTLILMAKGKKPKKWGACYYTEVGKGWGGLELGMFFLTNEKAPERTKNHELGHAIQNCYFGFLMPFVVSLPSAIRYWYRRIRTSLGMRNKGKYEDVWYEGQATKIGTEYAAKWGANT